MNLKHGDKCPFCKGAGITTHQIGLNFKKRKKWKANQSEEYLKCAMCDGTGIIDKSKFLLCCK